MSGHSSKDRAAEFKSGGRAPIDFTTYAKSQLLQLVETQRNWLENSSKMLPEHIKRIADSHAQILKELERRKLAEETKKQLNAERVNQQFLSTFEWNAAKSTETGDLKKDKAPELEKKLFEKPDGSGGAKPSNSSEQNKPLDEFLKTYVRKPFHQPQTLPVPVHESLKLFKEANEYLAAHGPPKKKKRGGFTYTYRKR